jgi:hypothetical protein
VVNARSSPAPRAVSAVGRSPAASASSIWPSIVVCRRQEKWRDSRSARREESLVFKVVDLRLVPLGQPRGTAFNMSRPVKTQAQSPNSGRLVTLLRNLGFRKGGDYPQQGNAGHRGRRSQLGFRGSQLSTVNRILILSCGPPLGRWNYAVGCVRQNISITPLRTSLIVAASKEPNALFTRSFLDRRYRTLTVHYCLTAQRNKREVRLNTINRIHSKSILSRDAYRGCCWSVKLIETSLYFSRRAASREN